MDLECDLALELERDLDFCEPREPTERDRDLDLDTTERDLDLDASDRDLDLAKEEFLLLIDPERDLGGLLEP